MALSLSGEEGSVSVFRRHRERKTVFRRVTVFFFFIFSCLFEQEDVSLFVIESVYLCVLLLLCLYLNASSLSVCLFVTA